MYRLVKFNPSIPHVQNCLALVVCEHRVYPPDHHMVSQHEELLQQCVLGESTYTLKFLVGNHLIMLPRTKQNKMHKR